MSISTIAKTKRDVTVTIKDLSAAHTLVISLERGDVNIGIPGPTVNVFLDRGRFGSTPSLRYGDDQPMTFSISGDLTDVSDATYATMVELFTQTGYVASTWVSVMGSTGEVKAYDVFIDIEGTDHNDSTDHQLILRNCVFTGTIADGDPITVSLSGTSYDLYPEVV